MSINRHVDMLIRATRVCNKVVRTKSTSYLGLERFGVFLMFFKTWGDPPYILYFKDKCDFVLLKIG